MLRFTPSSPGCSVWALLGKSLARFSSLPGARRDSKMPAGREGLFSQLTKPQDVRSSRHIGTPSGPSLGVICPARVNIRHGCSGPILRNPIGSATCKLALRPRSNTQTSSRPRSLLS